VKGDNEAQAGTGTATGHGGAGHEADLVIEDSLGVAGDGVGLVVPTGVREVQSHHADELPGAVVFQDGAFGRHRGGQQRADEGSSYGGASRFTAMAW